MADPFRTISRLLRLGRAFHMARREARGLATPMERALWQQKQATLMLAALEIEVAMKGDFPAGGLVVCNHLSYVDILVIASRGPVCFVAKSDVRQWPVVGFLVKSAGTIFVERDRRLAAEGAKNEIRSALRNGLPVVLFPEGTSSDGMRVLPFRATLLQAAIDAGAPVTPAALAYESADGNAGRDVCYWGDATFFPHLIRLAGVSRVRGTLFFGEARALGSERRRAADQLHEEVINLLAAGSNL